MKKVLGFSVLLNLVLLGGVIFVLTGQRQTRLSRDPILSGVKSLAPATTSSVAPAPFRWSQLVPAKDYGMYIAHLRAIGCPEATIEDIVRGDTERAFAWERNQLGLDGSGTGPWSRLREMQLVANLLGGQSAETAAVAPGVENPMREDNGGAAAQVPVPSQSAGVGTSHYPLFLQNVNWSVSGFDASQQAAIVQVRRQFLDEVNSLNQDSSGTVTQNPDSANAGATTPNPSASAPLTQWQQALQTADDQLRDLLGAQGYAAYEQQQYYAWYQPQVVAASAGDGNLTINPDAFSLK